MKKLLITAICASAMTTSLTAFAKVSPEVAAKLGKSLTVVGAEKAGNADGTIPAFTGVAPEFPESVINNPTAFLPNIYADEEPVVVITAENYKQHADKITDGLQKMFEKYPETFRMPIYPTHRDMVVSDFVAKNSKINATSATLTGGGNGVTGSFGASPFPIPQNGAEVMWNNSMRVGPRSYDVTYDSFAIYKSGKRSQEKTRTQTYAPANDFDNTRENFSKNEMVGYQLVQWLYPQRRYGEVILVHEPLDLVTNPRSAWTYMPSTRRVRRAPVVAYDSPSGPGKLITTDDGRMFNGAFDRYNWELVGKQEKYIPYNNYALDNPEISYDELLNDKHINPEYMRYELHRVWHVKATLKEGQRHIYETRHFYLDEDTWFIQLADNYDARGNLWRTNMATMVYNPHLPGPYARVWAYHDLQAETFAVEKLVNDQEDYDNLRDDPLPLDVFTPSGIRMLTRQ